MENIVGAFENIFNSQFIQDWVQHVQRDTDVWQNEVRLKKMDSQLFSEENCR